MEVSRTELRVFNSVLAILLALSTEVSRTELRAQPTDVTLETHGSRSIQDGIEREKKVRRFTSLSRSIQDGIESLPVSLALASLTTRPRSIQDGIESDEIIKAMEGEEG